MKLSSLLPRDYPYMYARVSAKRAKLLDARDYEDLLKMEPNEIARSLEEGEYKHEIDELGAKYDGVELVELALNRNLSNTMQELVEMAPPRLEEIIDVYLRRFDILSLKRLLRWKSGESERDSRDLFVPVSRYSFDELASLMEKDYEEIVESIRFPDSETDYQSYITSMELSEVEDSLDKAYAAELAALCEKVSSPQFVRFIRRELKFENLMTALRLKKYGFSYEEIDDRLVNGQRSDLLEEIMNAEDLEEAMQRVADTGRVSGHERLEDLEHDLMSERLRKAVTMVHAEPLGITSILGYVVAKHIEIKNLRMLIRAKETGVQNIETVRKNLVIAE